VSPHRSAWRQPASASNDFCPVLVAADAGRALLARSIPLAALLQVLRIEQLYVVAALVGVLTVIFDVADQAFLPSVVPRERLVAANSTLGASDSMVEIGGPALSGDLVQWLSAPVAIVFDGSPSWSLPCAWGSSARRNRRRSGPSNVSR
jgi:hypothetical protein